MKAFALLALGGASIALASPARPAQDTLAPQALPAAVIGPHAVPVDELHPDAATRVEPGYGGTVTVHLASMPKRLNYALENSSAARWVLYELHEFLVQKDWEMWDVRPSLATHWETEDTLVLRGGRTGENGNIVYGRVSEDGDAYVATPASPGNPLAGERRVPKAEVERLERATVFTFHLREGVLWHDGHPLDANDVLFSWRLHKIPGVDSDFHRYRFDKIVHAEGVDARTVRFFFGEQYALALETFAEELVILPAHLFDLLDPSHPRHDAEASLAAQAREINENPCNTRWVGLGPYRLKSLDSQVIEAERFPGYYDPEHGGYFDTIRWRVIPNDDTAFQALINGELDFFNRLSSEDYFGNATQRPEFCEHFYKGCVETGAFNYTPWNLRRPLFADLRVRKALAMAFDMPQYIERIAHGLDRAVTGSQFAFGAAYDQGLAPLPYDPDAARELLSTAGWYDRDGDGLLDKDGAPFTFEFLVLAGNKPARIFAQKLQEDLGRLGIRVSLTELEWASYIERVYARDFDAAGLSWSVIVPEADPWQLWHSSGAPVGVRGSNHPGVADPHVDELIVRGQRELERDKRYALWRELQRYLYQDVQPYLFRDMPPRKFAVSHRIRGFQAFQIDPGYSIRRWYLPAGTPGTRPAR
jgi:peptide/nickel transport system substrate-binding protein